MQPGGCEVGQVQRDKNNTNQTMDNKSFHYQYSFSDGRMTPLTTLGDLRDASVIYVIPREEIERCYTDRMVHDLRIDRDNPFASAGPGKMIFMVTGYDDDSRELMHIPEFIRFARKAEKAKPCWLYFAAPGSGWPRIILAACSQTGPPKHLVEKDFIEIPVPETAFKSFVTWQLTDFGKLCKLAGFKKKAASKALHKAVRELLEGTEEE